MPHRAYYTPREEVHSVLLETAPVLNPPGTLVSYNSPSFETYYERTSAKAIEGTGSIKGLRPWHPFQHYKRWLDHGTGTFGANLPYVVYRVGDFSGPRAVIHIRSLADLLLGPGWQYGSSPGDPTEGLPVFNDTEVSDEDEFISPPEDLDDLISVSTRKLVPHLKEHLSLFNTLIELKDWVTLRHTFQGLKQLITRAKERGVRGTLRELLRSTADLFLQWNFNLAPLISDIQGIHDALVQQQAYFKRLVAASGSLKVSRFRLKFKEFDDSTDEPTFPFNGAYLDCVSPQGGYVTSTALSATNAYRIVKYSPSEFYAQLRYVATYTETQKALASSFIAIPLSLGLEPSLKKVWDALPWTFVIDWVAKVGPWLDRFSTSVLDPVLDIYDYSWTIKRQRTVSVKVLWTMGGNDIAGEVGSQWVALPDVQEVAYRRQPTRPDKNTLILCGLTSQQFRLATALIITRRTKPRKNRSRRGGLPTGRRRRPKSKHAK